MDRTAERLSVREARGGSYLDVRVQTRSPRARVAGIRQGALALRVTAPPVQGKATAAARSLLSDFLKIPPSGLTVVAGEKARLKVFFVAGVGAAQLRLIIERKLKDIGASL